MRGCRQSQCGKDVARIGSLGQQSRTSILLILSREESSIRTPKAMQRLPPFSTPNFQTTSRLFAHIFMYLSQDQVCTDARVEPVLTQNLPFLAYLVEYMTAF
jgi:hypothetical protein